MSPPARSNSHDIVDVSKSQRSFLALLCATAQQSYCRHAGVRRPSSVRHPSVLPSVKPVFSETDKQINAKFGRNVSFTISPDHFFFQNFAFLAIFVCSFLGRLTWGSMGNDKMCDILETAGPRAKRTKSWAPGVSI